VLSDGLLSGQFSDNAHILIGFADGKLTFTQTDQVVGAPDVPIRPLQTVPTQPNGGDSLLESLVA
jgi:hypothetical protein